MDTPSFSRGLPIIREGQTPSDSLGVLARKEEDTFPVCQLGGSGTSAEGSRKEQQIQEKCCR